MSEINNFGLLIIFTWINYNLADIDVLSKEKYCYGLIYQKTHFFNNFFQLALFQ